ncbi:hypothetical protein ACWEVD_28870 [Nocardia thailandica]|uniref:hypothetical protein n=1 Tax=Nocardia thailandica TaxID=257275 RepID=UPI0002E8A28F|nr:hypothetical protein [Nocardia thailandica]
MFGTYLVLLLLSGIVLIVLAAVAKVLGTGFRVLNGLWGAGFLIYGSYLVLTGTTDHQIMWAIFVMPAVMIVRFLQSLDGGAPAPEPLAQGIGADALGAESRS